MRLSRVFTGIILAFGVAVAAGSPADAVHSAAERALDRREAPEFRNGSLGELRIGMTGRRAVRTGQLQRLQDPDICGSRFGLAAPLDQHAYVVMKGKPQRITKVQTRYRDDTYATSKGLRNGDTLRAIRRAYPQKVRVRPDPYEPSTFRALVRGSRSYLNFVFDTDGARPLARSSFQSMGTSRKRPAGLEC